PLVLVLARLVLHVVAERVTAEEVRAVVERRVDRVLVVRDGVRRREERAEDVRGARRVVAAEDVLDRGARAGRAVRRRLEDLAPAVGEDLADRARTVETRLGVARVAEARVDDAEVEDLEDVLPGAERVVPGAGGGAGGGAVGRGDVRGRR